MLSVLLSLTLTQIVVGMAHRHQWVVKPKADRWHQVPTALYGGVAIVATSVLASVVVLLRYGPPRQYALYGLLIGGVVLFAIGLRDDAKPLNPLVKLLGQVMAIMPFLVGLGLSHPTPVFIVAFPIVLLWMVMLTNSMNLLDNMNGLAAGTAAIIGGLLAVYTARHAEPLVAELSALISAACLGFLYFNARFSEPARIFMGDCGSMFLGYMLAGLIVLGVCHPTSALASSLAVPLLFMALPIFDTALVIVRRKREGRAISQGGKDHTSHRLVYAGCSEKLAVCTLYGVTALGGGLALVMEHLQRPDSLIASVLLAAFGLWQFGCFLSRFTGPRYAAVSTPVRDHQLDPNPTI